MSEMSVMGIMNAIVPITRFNKAESRLAYQVAWIQGRFLI